MKTDFALAYYLFKAEGLFLLSDPHPPRLQRQVLYIDFFAVVC